MYRQAGFTLVETMVVVAIVAILAAVVYPMFTGYMSEAEARRADGKIALVEAAQTMERYFTNNNTYAGASIPSESARGYYSLTLVTANTTSFTLEATAQGSQLRDLPECQTLRMNHMAQRTSGPPEDPNDPEECW